MPPPTQARGDTTRKDIIRMARRLFSEHGYHQTGIADIQAATGLTKGAFYHHFRSKEALGLAVLEAARADYRERLVGPALNAATPAGRIVDWLDRLVALNREPEWLNCRMLMTLSAEVTEVDTRLYAGIVGIRNDFREVLGGMLRDAGAAGELNDGVDPGMWTEWILCTFAGAQSARKLGDSDVDAGRIVDCIKRMLIKASVLEKLGTNTMGADA